ncbi:MAG: hypothetical protein K0Q85_65 [Caproiciproducens sp.]|jgi:hypothetical protein|nr:hypothetical protein [Caproiciproducens sp.]
MRDKISRCGSCQFSEAIYPNGRIKYCVVHKENVSAQRVICEKYTPTGEGKQ